MLAVIGSDDFLYKVLFLLHILSAIVAFAPAFVWPIVNVQTRKTGREGPGPIAGLVARNTMTIHGPALVLVGLFGILMVVTVRRGLRVLAGVDLAGLPGVVRPARRGLRAASSRPRRRSPTGDEAAEKKVAMFGGIAHTLLLVMLILMIWKPGLPRP